MSDPKSFIEDKYGNIDEINKDKLPPLDKLIIESLQNSKARTIENGIEIDEDIPLPLIINI